MHQVPGYQFHMNDRGRCGTISCVFEEQTLDLYWEMSGVPEYHILLAPVDLRSWQNGSLLGRDQQLSLLQALRLWLAEQKILTDIAPAANKVRRDTACACSGCPQAALEQSAYCPAHYDEQLLR